MHRSMERNVALSEVTSRLGLKFGMKAERSMTNLCGSTERSSSEFPLLPTNWIRSGVCSYQTDALIPFSAFLAHVASRDSAPGTKNVSLSNLESPPSRQNSREGGAPRFPPYCAGASDGAAGAGTSAVTSGAAIGLIFTVARICCRRLKTLSRSTCLTRPSPEASVVTFRANS